MIVYPTLELQGGRTVTLNRGRLDEPMVWHVDPVETARNWAAAGASWMHLTDFDGVDGRSDNSDLILEIIRSVGIPVQLGGGFRTADQVAHWIDQGAGRIVIGTLAARDPQTVKELAKYHPDQIVLSVDVWQGQVMTDGWRNPSAFTPEAFISAFDDAPLAGIVITDIDNDLEAETVEGHLGVISGLAKNARSPVIASGVVRSADDIARLKYVPNISGAIVGRALFRKTLDIETALSEARRDPEPVAEFI